MTTIRLRPSRLRSHAIGGVNELRCTLPLTNRDDLAIAYMAEVARGITRDPGSIWHPAVQRRTIEVVTDRTHVIGEITVNLGAGERLMAVREAKPAGSVHEIKPHSDALCRMSRHRAGRGDDQG